MTPDKKTFSTICQYPVWQYRKTAFVLLMLRQDCLSILKTNWVYERLTAGVVNDIIHEHNFSRLRHTLPEDFPVEKLASFAVMQLMLNLHNPQNKNLYNMNCLNSSMLIYRIIYQNTSIR
jgi:hypothetical protein